MTIPPLGGVMEQRTHLLDNGSPAWTCFWGCTHSSVVAQGSRRSGVLMGNTLRQLSFSPCLLPSSPLLVPPPIHSAHQDHPTAVQSQRTVNQKTCVCLIRPLPPSLSARVLSHVASDISTTTRSRRPPPILPRLS